MEDIPQSSDGRHEEGKHTIGRNGETFRGKEKAIAVDDGYDEESRNEPGAASTAR
jgi:hypothetical protein